ncbi:hypothetical protein [Erythrobacter sp. THAF29]|uniref:CIS tube protein n=1 Tax=Erythrobacter sp. THAF29 TaxID=2587851 RepID=UPI0012A7B9B7|nr:hypothetical protein [Erythrobacter sp. THAF29]QFT76049.1 hypothetical protein FIU90_00705 [Erythrobacter sp. THAF29]
MERVAFLIERSGDTITCLMNPEGLLRRRTSGLAERRATGGILGGTGHADNPLIATGGGSTELELRLLFDGDIAQEGRQSSGPPDIRELTEPFWRLSENGTENTQRGPPVLRFIWGTSWNIPCIATHVAERLEHFDADGRARRSWMSLRLRRVSEAQSEREAASSERSGTESGNSGNGPGEVGQANLPLDEDGGPMRRFDEVAASEYGNPEMAWALAGANGIDDPLTIAGQSQGQGGGAAQIALPPVSALSGFGL